jgi:hypothetical protein
MRGSFNMVAIQAVHRLNVRRGSNLTTANVSPSWGTVKPGPLAARTRSGDAVPYLFGDQPPLEVPISPIADTRALVFSVFAGRLSPEQVDRGAIPESLWQRPYGSVEPPRLCAGRDRRCVGVAKHLRSLIAGNLAASFSVTPLSQRYDRP